MINFHDCDGKIDYDVRKVPANQVRDLTRSSKNGKIGTYRFPSGDGCWKRYSSPISSYGEIFEYLKDSFSEDVLGPTSRSSRNWYLDQSLISLRIHQYVKRHEVIEAHARVELYGNEMEVGNDMKLVGRINRVNSFPSQFEKSVALLNLKNNQQFRDAHILHGSLTSLTIWFQLEFLLSKIISQKDLLELKNHRKKVIKSHEKIMPSGYFLKIGKLDSVTDFGESVDNDIVRTDFQPIMIQLNKGESDSSISSIFDGFVTDEYSVFYSDSVCDRKKWNSGFERTWFILKKWNGIEQFESPDDLPVFCTPGMDKELFWTEDDENRKQVWRSLGRDFVNTQCQFDCKKYYG